MTLTAQFTCRVGELDLSVDMHATPGQVTAILGPNGAGKTTILRCLAGARPIDAGTIRLGDTTLDEPPRTFVRPERRHFAIVHQDGVLFPHLSVEQNVAFGPRARGLRGAGLRQRSHHWLERVGLAARAGARPDQLSGGEAQKVAIARALAADPAVLLLDEPLASVDARSRVALRRELRRYVHDFAGPTVLVTHDPVDALALADHVVILENGTVVQTGDMRDVTLRPRSRYVSDLVGTNLLFGVADGTEVSTPSGTVITTGERTSGDVCVLVPPSAVALYRKKPEGSPRNCWRLVVQHIDDTTEHVRVEMDGALPLIAEVTRGAVGDLRLREGTRIWATVKATQIAAYPR